MIRMNDIMCCDAGESEGKHDVYINKNSLSHILS